jgi:1-acyl-sn-glycerol-3-phosphate acyltransferase
VNRQARSRWHRFLKRVLRFLMFIGLRVEKQDLDKVPRQGAVLVYCNHANFLDPVVVSAVMDRDIAIMGKQEMFDKPITGLIYRLYGVFPIRRTEGDVSAFRRAMTVLHEGGLLIIAPEGTRNGTGRLQRGKPGLIDLALRTGALIQPVSVLGVLPFYANMAKLRRTNLVVRAGEPYHPKASSRKPPRDEVQRLTDEAMYRLAALMPAELRGVYADVVAGAPATAPLAAPDIAGS